MKSWVLIFIVGFGLAFKCNTNWRERKNRKILLQGYVLNEQRVYHLGDTIYFEVVIPDTITIQDNNTNSIELIPVKSLQWASYDFWVNRVDTINNRDHLLTDNQVDALYNNKKTEAFGTVNFRAHQKPYRELLRLIPKSKGLFYLKVDKLMAGNIKINGEIEGVLSTEIGNRNKHLDLIYPYLPSLNHSSTYDYYAFKVE